MTYKLFLDDERYPGQVTWIKFAVGPYVIVRSYDEFVKYITENGVPSVVSFDHDLADQHYKAMASGSNDYGPEKTGYDAAKWLVALCQDNDLEFPEYYVHSMNPIGARNIQSYIENAVRHGAIRIAHS